jgi:type VI protein secretion system component VasA
VNLFQESARPIDLDHRSAEYEVIANRNSEGVKVYSVDEVEGIVSGTGERHRYVPFYSFQHLSGTDGRLDKPRYYHLNTRPNVDGQLKTYLSFASEPEETSNGNRFF